MALFSLEVLAESPRSLSPLVGIGAPFEWIYDFPNIGVALLFGIAGACLLAGVPFLREKVLHIRVPSAHSEATDKALAVGDQLYGARSGVLTGSGKWQSS